MAWKLPTFDELKDKAAKRAQHATDFAAAKAAQIAKDASNRAIQIAADPKGAVKDLSDGLNAAGDRIRENFDAAKALGQDALQAARDLRQDIDSKFQRVDDEIEKLPETIDGLKQQLARNINRSSDGAGESVEKGLDFIDKYSNYLSIRGAIVTVAAGALRNNAKSMVGDAMGSLAKAIRGDKMAFIDTIVQEPSPREKLTGTKPDVRAMIYIPNHENADKNGIGVFPERTLLELELQAHNTPDEASVFREARAAVREKKAELKVHVQTTLYDEPGHDEIIPRL